MSRCGSLAGIGNGKTSFPAASALGFSEVDAALTGSGVGSAVALSPANFLPGIESLNVRSSETPRPPDSSSDESVFGVSVPAIFRC